MDERVLVLPAEHVRTVADFTGFLPAAKVRIDEVLNPAKYQFRLRSEVEIDPSFKQLIPYVVLSHQGRIFHYTRGSSGGETRLHALRSIGIGGHISEADAAGAGDAYQNGLARELDEEVTHGAIVSRELLGFIHDPRTAVGEVHLGVVHRFELEAAIAMPREEALTNAGFAPIEELQELMGEFESWSQLTLEWLRSSDVNRSFET
jgi:predicted NUDIX family phosphoesterase